MYYSIDMRLKSWMPGFVKNVLKNQALTQVPAYLPTPHLHMHAFGRNIHI